MARTWTRKRADAPSGEPATIHEITRRYYACAVALARAMGVPLSETFLREHRESISCCFIEAGRAGVRLPPAVPLPPLHGPPGAGTNGQAPDASTTGNAVVAPQDSPPAPEPPPATNGQAPPPVAIPKDAGLPCGGVAIEALKPAQLAMLVGKVARLVHDEGERWIALLGSLQAERAGRLARGRKPTHPAPDLDPVGHVEVEEG